MNGLIPAPRVAVALTVWWGACVAGEAVHPGWPLPLLAMVAIAAVLLVFGVWSASLPVRLVVAAAVAALLVPVVAPVLIAALILAARIAPRFEAVTA